MSNSIKDAFDKASLINGIQERENIIREFRLYGILNREHAISNIIELRAKDKEVHTAYTLLLSPNSKPLSEFLNTIIINELEYQVAILTIKLANREIKSPE